MTDTILIVDDEEPVRRTFAEWLAAGVPAARVLVAADAEDALRHANQHAVDLAVLDWNLGAGNDGLRLLEDLSVFQPDIVAILVTGYAHQATPLDALRMGVRDYLDKNQDLNRDTFLGAVRKQLDRIRPAKQHRELHRQLAAFRAAVEQVLPLVQSAAALNDPVPLPRAVAGLTRFLCQVTGAKDGVLLVRNTTPESHETYRSYSADGEPLEVDLVPFERSVAATALSFGEPCVMNDLAAAGAAVERQPFERGRSALLAAPLAVGPGVQAVLELFDRPGGFRDEDRRLAAAAADIGAELLRQALAERAARRTLFDAVAAALDATQKLASADGPPPAPAADEPPPAAVLDRLRANLESARSPAVGGEAALRLAEAVRELAVRHGPPAVEHCIRMVQGVRELLDSIGGV
ncbi:MAG TPA: response regulator [Gemmataceae bacterium]|jgi:ActR/RegA family two-component response regulator